MNKYVKIMGVMALGLLVANCSGTNYKIKTEKSKVLNEVPKWYVNDFSKKKACNTPRFGKDKNKMWSSQSFSRDSVWLGAVALGPSGAVQDP